MSDKQQETTIGFVSGMVGGLTKFYTHETTLAFHLENIYHINWEWPSRLFEAAVAALVCGFVGALGKHLLTLLIKKINSYNNKKLKR